jgi:uncharacterized membrane protein YdjX (TVP38/TMEM64 family)
MRAPADMPSLKPTVPNGFRLLRLVPLAIILIGTAVVFAAGLDRELSLEALVRRRDAIDMIIEANKPLAIVAYITLYTSVITLLLPVSAFMTVCGGLLFGTTIGVAAALTSATVGGTVIFLVTRSAVGDHLFSRANPRLRHITREFRADAFSYLLFLRLTPLLPFWVVSVVAALGGARLVPFIAATVIGITPVSFVYAFFGAGLDNAIDGQVAAYKACIAAGRPGCRLEFDLTAAATPQLIAALAALCLVALTPVIIRRIRTRRRAPTV